MDKRKALTPETFATLLGWLGSDDEAAAAKYENIRQGLIRMFTGRGCHEAELLADRTIDRVAEKLAELVETYEGDPALYFYGVAKHIFHERLRGPKEVDRLNESTALAAAADENRKNIEKTCLRDCLRSLSESDHNLIVDYYRGEGQKKIKLRNALAKRLGITANALQIRAHRLRIRLSKCVKVCVDEKKI